MSAPRSLKHRGRDSSADPVVVGLGRLLIVLGVVAAVCIALVVWGLLH